MLGLVRSVKNSFAPVNRIPSDVFSLIPGHWGEDDGDQNLITLTHVCRGWRELLIARSSLWACLDCMNFDKTRVYIERSKSSPLELSLYKRGASTYLEDAFHLVIPQINRLRSLRIIGRREILTNITPHISNPIPHLRELTVDLTSTPASVLEGTLPSGDLPSLCSLTLAGVVTNLPWKNLSKLTTFKLSCVPEGKISITQLLNFFMNARQLTDIDLHRSIPPSSDAPPGRVVSLPCLKNFTIHTKRPHSILLNHLRIPIEASLVLEYDFDGDRSPLPEFLPKDLGNLGNVLSIESVNLRFDKVEKSVRLDGRNGQLYMFGHRKDPTRASSALDSRIIRSLGCFTLCGTRRLAISLYGSPKVAEVGGSAPYHILSKMRDLRTLLLSQSNNLPFIFALNPDQNSSKVILCPKLGELVLYVEGLEGFYITELMCMVEERASRGAKLSLVTIVGLGDLMPKGDVFKLKRHVTRVNYKIGENPPKWDSISGHEDD